jgi:aryl-alcohol dehydrogenase-like predicted oxidoreductase
LSERQIIDTLEGSLKRLDTDYVDLYYLDWPDPGTALDESLGALDQLVRSGKVRYTALSNHPAWQVAVAAMTCAAKGYAMPVVIQDEYSLLVRDAERELFPACRHFGLSLVPYLPLAGGFLTGKYRRGNPIAPGVRGFESERFNRRWLTNTNYDRLESLEEFARQRAHTIGELAIGWLLSNPLICSVIAGVTSAAQLEDNVRMAGWKVDPAELQGAVAGWPPLPLGVDGGWTAK